MKRARGLRGLQIHTRSTRIEESAQLSDTGVTEEAAFAWCNYLAGMWGKDPVAFDPWRSRTKSPSGKSQVSGDWGVEKTQEMSKTEVEELLKGGGFVVREENGQLHGHVRKNVVSGEFFYV